MRALGYIDLANTVANQSDWISDSLYSITTIQSAQNYSVYSQIADIY